MVPVPTGQHFRGHGRWAGHRRQGRSPPRSAVHAQRLCPHPPAAHRLSAALGNALPNPPFYLLIFKDLIYFSERERKCTHKQGKGETNGEIEKKTPH